jgi:hypothetical protein
MRHAFACQNGLGRLCDEAIYKNDLAARPTTASLGLVRVGPPVTVSHKSFARQYFADLIVADAAIY